MIDERRVLSQYVIARRFERDDEAFSAACERVLRES
jgi:hypothetical protein